MNVKGIIWAGLSVADIAASIKFYRDIVGLRLLRNGEGWAHFDAGNGALFELTKGGVASATAKNVTQQAVVIGFLVDDLEQTVNELERRGIPFLSEIGSYKNQSWTQFSDPEGNRIEVKQVVRKEG